MSSHLSLRIEVNLFTKKAKPSNTACWSSVKRLVILFHW